MSKGDEALRHFELNLLILWFLRVCLWVSRLRRVEWDNLCGVACSSWESEHQAVVWGKTRVRFQLPSLSLVCVLVSCLTYLDPSCLICKKEFGFCELWGSRKLIIQFIIQFPRWGCTYSNKSYISKCREGDECGEASLRIWFIDTKCYIFSGFFKEDINLISC